jgi:hypothetical protein
MEFDTYMRQVMEQVKRRHGESLFDATFLTPDLAEKEMKRMYDMRIPPSVAADGLATGRPVMPRILSIQPGSSQWMALVSVYELARARVADIHSAVEAAGATEGRIKEVLRELASHVDTIDSLVNSFGGYMPNSDAM